MHMPIAEIMSKKTGLRLSVAIILLITHIYPQSVLINEIMSSNSITLADEDGDFSDWLELYNPTGVTIDPGGYGLSDDADEPMKWTLPSISLEPHGFLLIFASGKDRKEFKHTVISRGDMWKYKIWTSQPPSSWTSFNYDDSQWLSGPTGIGYGDGDDATQIPTGTISVYARKTFEINNPNDIINGILTMDYDDGFVAYLNGTEIARANLAGNPPAYNQNADPDHEAMLYRGILPENFTIEDIATLLVTGENILAIEIHNVNAYSSDFSFIPYLTLGMSSKPENLFVPDELLFNQATLHTNFKISADGEDILLTHRDGIILDHLVTGAIPADISRGRQPDGGEDWLLFDEPTPGKTNSTSGFSNISPTVIFDQSGGFYPSSVTVALSLEDEKFPVYYTLDCTEPTENSVLYIAPLSLSETTVIRAKSISPNALPGKISTRTFIIGQSHDLPVVALATNPTNLWDPDSGIYVFGTDYSPDIPYFGANFWEDWERPVHVELYEPDGSLGFAIDAGIKIFGGWSRSKPQKSLAIYARKKYGASQIDYQVFPDRMIYTFENIVLRNSANDFEFTMLRDGFMQSLIEGTTIDDQAYRPAVVYINGEYWGIHNIREKLNEHYVASHYNVDPDNIDLLESFGTVNDGDADEWWHLYNFINENDLSLTENYEYVKNRIDMLNFMQYYIAEIYFDNTDWPGNNIKYWREKSNSGKWRWILFDTDFGFGLYENDDRYKFNTLEFALEPNGPDWPNPPWSTLFLRKLLESDGFKNEFVNCFCDMLNTRFTAKRVEEKLNEAKNRIVNEMPGHIAKWPDIGSMNNWYANLSKMQLFGRYRSIYCISHLYTSFSLQGAAVLTLNINPENSGIIRLNTIDIEDTSWRGNYFKGIPLKIEAVPKPGYMFDRWGGDLESPDIEPEDFILYGNMTINCNFSITGSAADAIVINEINYKSADDFDTGDWVEIFNNSNVTVDMGHWIFKDSEDDHVFEFPEAFQMAPQAFIVLTNVYADFHNFQPEISNVLGDFDFGLGKSGEIVRLYDASGALVDSVNFNSVTPWPSEPNGSGVTLILKNPDLDNSLPENWTFSQNHGNPGESNFPSGTNDSEPQIPLEYTLMPNYPNPFNSSTVIAISLPKPGFVELLVFDLNGKLAAEIENANYSAGNYAVNFQPGPSVASSIYFCHLIIDKKIIKTIKMVYLK